MKKLVTVLVIFAVVLGLTNIAIAEAPKPVAEKIVKIDLSGMSREELEDLKIEVNKAILALPTDAAVIHETSRRNPATIGQSVEYTCESWDNSKGTYRITLLEVVRGEKIDELYPKSNTMFDLSSSTPEGMEDILMKFRVEFLSVSGTDNDPEVYFSRSIVNGDGSTNANMMVMRDTRGLESIHPMREGASVEGYEWEYVKKDDASPYALCTFGDGSPEIWFSLATN